MSLEKNVAEWLRKRGYPLEMEVAQILKRAGFGVVQSEFYEDRDGGTWRETDVIAYEESRESGCHAVFGLVAECKGSKDKPWVLFSAADNYPKGLSISRRASSEEGESILRSLAFNTEIADLSLFKVPERPGYGLTVALRDDNNKDYAYEALMSVCKAALGLISQLTKAPHAEILPFAWPVIVVNAPLLEAYLDNNGSVQTRQIEKGLLIWRNPVITRHTLVQIYTKSCFALEAGSIRTESKKFLEAAVAEKSRRSKAQQDG